MKKIFALLAAFAALTSCSVKEPVGPERAASSPILHASFEGLEGTRTFVDGSLHLFWTADDRLSVFLGTTYNQQYRFTGETGDNAGDFEEVPASGLHSGSDVNAIYAVYPYRTTTKLSYDGKITVDLPAVQQYAPGTFGLGANTMVAVTAGKADTFLPFKNLCGYLVVKLYGSGTVKSVTIEGNNGEKLAGKATVSASHNAAPSLALADDAATSITIDCGEGVTLGSTAETATEFWFCIPPVTFSKGFTITATGSAGSFSKSTTSSRTIERNVRVSMPALEFIQEGPAVPEMVDLGLSVKWASFNIGASKPEEVGGYFAWGEIEPKTSFDWSNYKWCNGSEYSMNKYCTSSSCGTVDGKTKLDDEDDAAIQILGDKWRMPTKAELDELVEKCTWTKDKLNGVNGYKVTGPSGRSIFLPCNGQADESGLHWSSTAAVIWASETDGGSNAYTLAATDDHEPWTEICHHRHDGECIRAVCGNSSSPAVPEMVDLGLPSGLKWANFNLGASKPEEYGDYYAWGETTTKKEYSWNTYKYCNGTNTSITKYCFSSSYGNVDNKSILDPSDDAASAILGDCWRMPTKAEWEELVSECSWTWMSVGNVYGYKVKGPSGNDIFLPAGGIYVGEELDYDNSSPWSVSGSYWSSELGSDNIPYNLDFDNVCPFVDNYEDEYRYTGESVRPVYGSAIKATGITLDKTSLYISVGENAELTATLNPSNCAEKGLIWSSSNATVATVSGSGLVTAVSSGTAVITVSWTGDSNLKASCTVTVTGTNPDIAVPEAIDLGLPSGIKWASFNLGASKPEEYGGYYQWAGLQNVRDESIILKFRNCPYHTGSNDQANWTKYIPSGSSSYWSGSGSPDNKNVLDPEDDVAHVTLGGKWRMPTKTEFKELIDNCNSEWTTLNGLPGRKFTSIKNGNSIFLCAAYYRTNGYLSGPESGNYWSSSLDSRFPTKAYGLSLDSDTMKMLSHYRSYGLSVRPVSE